ncbi:MAG: hypothetical protein L0287_16625 [Anaerolineae bacterium]|nr:hypothetical protein [Anaerolineae bacterium]MCI0608379.1 hypothetical protein [Anaerolineae bacterium]
MAQSLDPNPQPSQPLAPDGSLQINKEVAVAELTRRMKRGANNFYWIAALSVINSILSMTGSGTYFVIGLAVTLIVDGVTIGLRESLPDASMIVRIIGLVLSILVAGVFALFGFFASQAKRWAFLVGMVLYGLDGLIMLAFADWIGVLFHAFFLWGLFGGWRALGELQKMSPQKATDFPQNIGVQ